MKNTAIEEKSTGNTRRTRLLYIAILILTFWTVYAYIYDAKLDLNGDNANYILLGKSILSGKGYVNIFTAEQTPNNQFPPGYPALLSIIMLLAPNSLFAIKIVNGLFLLGTVLLFFFILIRLLRNQNVAFVFTLFLLCNSHLLRYATIEMSEIPFLFFSMLSLFFYGKVDFSSKTYFGLNFLLSLSLLLIAIYIRALGIALAGAYVLDMLTKKRIKHVIVLAVFSSICLLPWQLRSNLLGPSQYSRALIAKNHYDPSLGRATFSDITIRIGENAKRYAFKEIPYVLFPHKEARYDTTTTNEYIFGFLVILVIGFAFSRPFPFRRLIGIYFITTFIILLLWPSMWIGVRFILGFLPILIFLLAVSFLNVLHWITIKTKIRLDSTVFILLIFLLPYFTEIKELHKQAVAQYPNNWRNYFSIAEWVKANTSKEAIVSCRKPELFHLFSNRLTTNYKFTKNAEELLGDLRNKKVSYVIIDNLGYASTQKFLIPAIEKNIQSFSIVLHFKNPDTYLLKINQ